METKKSNRADLQSKRPLFIQLGLIVALSVVLFAFELRHFSKPLPQIIPGDGITLLDETIINTRREQPPPPPAPLVPLTRIEIVDNHREIEEILPPDYNFFPELAPWQPPLPRQEVGNVDPPQPVWIPEVFAEFRGGEEALFRWLSANLRYPQPELQAGIQGVVYVQFVVEADGSISQVSVARGNFGGGLEKAAVEIVKRMPPWTPGKQRNRPVPTWFVLPINFIIK